MPQILQEASPRESLPGESASQLESRSSKGDPTGRASVTLQGADKEALRRTFDGLFTRLRIEPAPVDIEKLQERTRNLDLEPNELSRALIAARGTV